MEFAAWCWLRRRWCVCWNLGRGVERVAGRCGSVVAGVVRGVVVKSTVSPACLAGQPHLALLLLEQASVLECDGRAGSGGSLPDAFPDLGDLGGECGVAGEPSVSWLREAVVYV